MNTAPPATSGGKIWDGGYGQVAHHSCRQLRFADSAARLRDHRLQIRRKMQGMLRRDPDYLPSSTVQLVGIRPSVSFPQYTPFG